MGEVNEVLVEAQDLVIRLQGQIREAIEGKFDLLFLKDEIQREIDLVEGREWVKICSEVTDAGKPVYSNDKTRQIALDQIVGELVVVSDRNWYDTLRKYSIKDPLPVSGDIDVMEARSWIRLIQKQMALLDWDVEAMKVRMRWVEIGVKGA